MANYLTCFSRSKYPVDCVNETVEHGRFLRFQRTDFHPYRFASIHSTPKSTSGRWSTSVAVASPTLPRSIPYSRS